MGGVVLERDVIHVVRPQVLGVLLPPAASIGVLGQLLQPAAHFGVVDTVRVVTACTEYPVHAEWDIVRTYVTAYLGEGRPGWA